MIYMFLQFFSSTSFKQRPASAQCRCSCCCCCCRSLRLTLYFIYFQMGCKMIRFDFHFYFLVCVCSVLCCARLTTSFVLRFECFTWLVSNGEIQQHPCTRRTIEGNHGFVSFHFISFSTVDHCFPCLTKQFPSNEIWHTTYLVHRYIFQFHRFHHSNRPIVANVNDNRELGNVSHDRKKRNEMIFVCFCHSNFKFKRMIRHDFASYFPLSFSFLNAPAQNENAEHNND